MVEETLKNYLSTAKSLFGLRLRHPHKKSLPAGRQAQSSALATLPGFLIGFLGSLQRLIFRDET
jgi:hypothetical protein